jgi:hypothetical protein
MLDASVAFGGRAKRPQMGAFDELGRVNKGASTRGGYWFYRPTPDRTKAAYCLVGVVEESGFLWPPSGSLIV